MIPSIDQRQRDADQFGWLYGYSFLPGGCGREIASVEALRLLQQAGHADAFLWLHLNLSHAACERWMSTHLDLPEEFFEALHEGSRSTRIEHVDSALLGGVHIDGVVNSVRHSHALKVHGFSYSPSKFLPAFGIDLHVDDSEGVRAEGYDHGFRVVVVQPDDTQWTQRVLDAVAEVQARLLRQQLLSSRVRESGRPEVFSS